MTDVSTLESIQTQLTNMTKKVDSLTKLVRKVRSHQEDPTGEKAKERSANNGFNRQQTITEELRAFLKLADGATISRGEVTKKFTTYVNENGLKHPDNGRHIVLDDTLTKLLNVPSDVQLSYMNLQKYMSVHYIKQGNENEKEKEKEKEKGTKKRPTVKKSKT